MSKIDQAVVAPLQTPVMQHTRGPWRLAGERPTFYLQSQHVDSGKANFWADICTLMMSNGCGKADVELISAAPELLAFAQWFLENRDGPGRSMAQAAVNKAAGAA